MDGWPTAPCSACPKNADSFIHQVRALTAREGTLLILDEMITGFRWHLKGAQHFFGVTPDLSTFGKAMANGFSLAAVTGRREVMEVGAINKPGLERTFLLSTTHGGEMPALGAFVEATRINKEEDVTAHLWDYGSKLRDSIAEVATRHGVSDYFLTEGPAVALNYITRDAGRNPSMPMRTLLAQELLRRGVMMPWISFSQAHGDIQLTETVEALDGALSVFKQALDGGVDRFLEGPPIKPVFRTHN